MNDYLPQRSLWRLLAAMLLVVAPHALRLPTWASVSVLLLLLWRLLASRQQWRMPPLPVKLALTIAASAGIWVSYGRFWGQHPGVALLVIMLALKLTELRAKRDVMVAVFILYFLLVTHFLYSQELWTIVYLLLSTVAITTVLVDVSRAREPLPLRVSARLAGSLVLQAMPLMLLMFVLFPRIPGPIWGLPEDAGAARTGMSDNVAPGDISQLAMSDAVAFRVKFKDTVPRPAQRYWRGPVLSTFDGRSWGPIERGGYDYRVPTAELRGAVYDYEITLEASRMHWLFALDLPSADELPEKAKLTSDYELVTEAPIADRFIYRLLSRPDYHLQRDLSPWRRKQQLALPSGYNPRSIELAQSWRANAASDQDVVQAALQMFRKEPFFYTLQPPPLGRDSVDDFVFSTRRGFCEHYSSSFTFLMRAAGIPARVVTGYQGAEQNPFGDYYVVRQSDAHAWSEVWLQDQGWVRVDPTAAVAPERIERGLTPTQGVASGAGDYLAGRLNWSALRYDLEARWDWINARWNGMVLGYGTELQRQFLERFGLGDWSHMLLALTGCVSAVLIVFGLVLLRRTGAPPVTDAALIQWGLVRRHLARLGIEQGPGEGPRDFAERVGAARPALSGAMQRVAKAYLRLRYEDQSTALADLKSAVIDLRNARAKAD